MAGYTEVVNTLREIRTFLRQTLTPQFMASLQKAINSVNQLLQDPKFSREIQQSVHKFLDLLNTLDKSKAIEQLTQAAAKINELLDSVDAKEFGELISALKNISTVINNFIMHVERIGNKLDEITQNPSIKKILEIAKTLAGDPLVYGSLGLMVGSIVLNIYKSQPQNAVIEQELKKLNEKTDNIIYLNYAQLKIQIQTQRTLSQMLLSIIENSRQEGVPLSAPTQRAYDENTRVLNALPEFSEEDFQLCVTSLDAKFSKLIKETLSLYPQKIGDVLEHLDDNEENWQAVVDYVVDDAEMKLVHKKPKPEFSVMEENYYKIQKKHGSKKIQALMMDLVKALDENGARELYEERANSPGNSSGHWAETIKVVVSKKEADSSWLESSKAQAFHYYYHAEEVGPSADGFIRTNWPQIIDEESLADLTPETLSIIKKRAILHLCQEYAHWLCFPRYVPRQMYNGAKDLVQLPWRIAREPRKYFTALFSLQTWKNLPGNIYEQPFRALMPSVIVGGVSAAASAVTAAPVAAPTTAGASVAAPVLKVTATMKVNVVPPLTVAPPAITPVGSASTAGLFSVKSGAQAGSAVVLNAKKSSEHASMKKSNTSAFPDDKNHKAQQISTEEELDKFISGLSKEEIADLLHQILSLDPTTIVQVVLLLSALSETTPVAEDTIQVGENNTVVSIPDSRPTLFYRGQDEVIGEPAKGTSTSNEASIASVHLK